MTSELDKELERSRSTVNALNEHVENTIVEIKEVVFVNKLLPIMREWISEKKGDNIHLWAMAAGGLERPMIVRTTDGYFMVPPPYNHLQTISSERPTDNKEIHAISQLIRMKEADGETRTVMELSNKLANMLDTSDNVISHAMYTIQLAKIWDRYGLPLEEILDDISLDLSMYDEHGQYINSANMTSGATQEETTEDELEY